MRSGRVYAFAAVAFAAVSYPAAGADQYRILHRQDSPPRITSPSAAGSGGRDSDPTATFKLDASRSSSSIYSTRTAPSTAHSAGPTSAPEPGRLNPTASTAAVPKNQMALNSSSNGTSIVDPNGLPLHPTITPALSVAGACLILSGVFYTLIGIKTKWLHIFLSSAYLTSLAVTVLIIYVMHPPISRAVQGAYVVAITITGVIFGGGSVVFADVTESLGCFLGGFCLSMWLLVLKPNGLLTSTAAKAIFIACFTMGAFAFYLSHHTRPYGLIGATSFAGATVVVLGVDCFSRAGLKEFWVYIWGLNEDIFPLRYKGPYPITRGIRVEIACIILLFILGVMSQLKVWNIIKERRNKKAAAQLEEDQRRDQIEEAVGRRLEEGNERERAMWEAVYGNKEQSRRQQPDSGIGTSSSGSPRKGSLSATGVREMRRSGTGSIEMTNLDRSNGSSRKGSHDGSRTQGPVQVTVQVASDEDMPPGPAASPEPAGEGENRVSQTSAGTSIFEPAAIMASIPPSTRLAASSAPDNAQGLKTSRSSTGPKVVPLPFQIRESDLEVDDDVSSIATFAASDQPPARRSNRFSGGEMVRSLSKRPQRPARSVSEEALMVPHIDDDQASSVAATVDDVSADRDTESEAASENEKSIRPTQVDNEGFAQKSRLTSQALKAKPGGGSLGAGLSQAAAAQNPGDGTGSEPVAANSNNADENTDPFHDTPFSGNVSPEEPLLADCLPKEQENPRIQKFMVSPEVSKTNDRPVTLSSHLPDNASKVVMAYRTNEWAKHLEAAETPELDDLQTQNTFNGLDAVERTESAAPVYVKDLQQTPLTAEPATLSTNHSRQELVSRSGSATSNESLNMHNPYRRSIKPLPRSSGPEVERSLSQTSLRSVQSKKELASSGLAGLPSSQISLTANRGYRSSSTPLAGSPIVASRIEEGVESSFPHRFTPSPMHLMSQRDSMMRNKPSSTSLNFRTSSPTLPLVSASYESIPIPGLAAEDDDNISLSKRRSLLQSQLQPSHSSLALPHRSSSGPAPTPRDSTFAAWRSSLLDIPAQQAAEPELDAHRTAMMAEKRRASLGQQWAHMEAGRMETGMRREDLMDRHREAMRRMQGMANRKL